MAQGTRKLSAPVLIVVMLIVVFAAFILFTLFNSSAATTDTPEAEATADYSDTVTALLANANPENAEAALVAYGCIACHRTGAANNVAPTFVGMAETAAERRAPMSAADYLYESIVHPGAYVVEGYANVMPQDLGRRMTEQELGDVIAYLLTPDAH